MTYQSIQPITRTTKIDGFTIFQVTVVPFQSATVVVLLQSQDAVVETKTIQMPTADYLQWNNDDSYLITFICAQLGVGKIL